MKDITNARCISTINQLYRANLDIFYYLWKTAIFKYDEFKIAIVEDSAGFVYRLNDIKLHLIIKKNNPVRYELWYKNECHTYSFAIPKLPITYDEHKNGAYNYFDKLLYLIYLCGTDKTYKIKKLDDLEKYFEEMKDNPGGEYEK